MALVFSSFLVLPRVPLPFSWNLKLAFPKFYTATWALQKSTEVTDEINSFFSEATPAEISFLVTSKQGYQVYIFCKVIRLFPTLKKASPPLELH